MIRFFMKKNIVCLVLAGIGLTLTLSGCSDRYPLSSPDDPDLLPALAAISGTHASSLIDTGKVRVIEESANPKFLLQWVSAQMPDSTTDDPVLELFSETTTEYPLKFRSEIFTLPEDICLFEVPGGPGSKIGIATIIMLNDNDNDGEIDNVVLSDAQKNAILDSAGYTQEAYDFIDSYPFLRQAGKDWVFGAAMSHFLLYFSDDNAISYFTEIAHRSRYLISDKFMGSYYGDILRKGFNLVKIVYGRRNFGLSWEIFPDTLIDFTITEGVEDFYLIPGVTGSLPLWLSELSFD